PKRDVASAICMLCYVPVVAGANYDLASLRKILAPEFLRGTDYQNSVGFVLTALGSQTPSYTSYDATCPNAGLPAYSGLDGMRHGVQRCQSLSLNSFPSIICPGFRSRELPRAITRRF